MANVTTCPDCGCAYEAGSEEQANEPDRLCSPCREALDRVFAVVGSRAHPNLDEVRAYINTLPRHATVISGGAKGVDTAAISAARERGMTTRVWLPADFKNLHLSGRRIDMAPRDAFLWRNTMLAIDCTEMAVFPEKSRGGCWDAADQARRFKRPVHLHEHGEQREYTGRGRRSPQASLW